MGQKILVSAPSNVAVDNIAVKLLEANEKEIEDDFKVKIVRIGHPVRVNDTIHPYTLDSLTKDSGNLVQGIKGRISETTETLRQLDRLKPNARKNRNDEIAQLRQTLKTQRKLLKPKLKLHQKDQTKQLKEADVVLGTLTGCKTTGPLKLLPADWFQLTVIDEAGQALEMACWIVMHRAPKLILAGDHLQLPPTILSNDEEAKRVLSKTLMERIVDRDGKWNKNGTSTMLQTQYRMNSKIMDWSSKRFYNSQLKAADQVKTHKLSDLQEVSRCELTKTVLKMIDTNGKMPEYFRNSSAHPSYANFGEAVKVMDYVASLVENGIKPDQIAVITPYSLQVMDKLSKPYD